MPVHRHEHPHSPAGNPVGRALWQAFLINASFLLIEAAGGWISGSLALLADAGHMLSDVAALAVVLWVGYASRRRATSNHSYGFGRIEVLSGLFNGLLLWAVALVIIAEAWRRLQDPQEIEVAVMLPVAVAGLLANLVSARLLFAHRSEDLNLRGAFLHMTADAAGSVGAILAALGIWLQGWHWIDPAASVLIAVLMVVGSWNLVRESVHILLEGTPAEINLDAVRRDLLALDGVAGCHDLHVWNVGSREPMLSAHLLRENGGDTGPILDAAKEMLRQRYQIRHSTLQVEDEPCAELHK